MARAAQRIGRVRFGSIDADWSTTHLARYAQAVLQGSFFLAKAAGDRTVALTFGGVMSKPKELPVSLWTYYFRVADVDQGHEQSSGRHFRLPRMAFAYRPG